MQIGKDYRHPQQLRCGTGVFDFEQDSGIMDTGVTSASLIFVNKDDQLFKNAQNITPIAGYEDVVSHSDQDRFYAHGNDGKEYTYSPVEFATMVKNSPNYHGGPIRLIACDAGATENGAAQRLANELGVNVLASTTTAWVYPDGDVFLGTTRKTRDGSWREFKPKAGGLGHEQQQNSD